MQSKFNLREEVKKAQDYISAQAAGFFHNTYIALDLDSCNMVLFANKQAFHEGLERGDMSPYLLSRYYEDAWNDREMFLEFGQWWIDEHCKESTRKE